MFQGNKSDIVGHKIISIGRQAKMIVINLADGISLLIHLKLTGQLIFSSSAGDQNKFTHIIFKFKDGSNLFFNDLRKFGYVKVYKTGDLPQVKELRGLGPEPYDKEFTPEYLMKVIARRPKIKIKQILMDQTIISGVGNIYADESLFCAKISPLRRAAEVSKSELAKLISCIKEVLNLGLRYGGSSENTFVNVEGKQGEMQNHFKVYRRNGQKCLVCKGVVKRIVIGGRGTHYCPACQS